LADATSIMERWEPCWCSICNLVILSSKVHLFHFYIFSGNWDLKTKVPQQCQVSKLKLPPYFMEWINLKDVYLNFYKRR
ncbi:hypothetical protein HN51_044617, partial [Arachis hypogaea]